MTILAFDIEASNLSADFGIVLCCGFKYVGKGKPTVVGVLDFMKPSDGGDLIKAEKRLLVAMSERLLEADVWLSHFGKDGRFDLNFINSRLLYHNLPVLPVKHPQIDTWKISRDHLKLRNNRLVTISEFLRTGDSKNAIKPEHWLRALGGHKASMAYIQEHCRLDVLVLEEVYLRLRSLDNQHPNKNLLSGKENCPTCGSAHLQSRGFRLTRTRKFPRYQCQECGSWSSGSRPLAITKVA